MTDMNPSFFGRLSIAFGAFFGILGNSAFAGRVQRLREAGEAPQTPEAPFKTPAPPQRPLPRPRPRPRR